MASILIKNIPPQLHTRLKERAARHRRSLNSETIHMLEEAVAEPESPASPPPVPVSEEILAKLPPEAAERLRALHRLRNSLAARNVDFGAWKQTAHDSRR